MASAFLKELKDRWHIEEALKRYLWGVDRDDEPLRLSAFAPNGSMEIEGLQFGGPLATPRSTFPPIQGVPPREQILSSDHHLHHFEIRIVGDEAFVASHATAYILADRQRGKGAEMLVRGLRYHDHFIRVGNDWGSENEFTWWIGSISRPLNSAVAVSIGQRSGIL